MLKILEDAEGRDDVFQPFGAIALEQIESWMRASSLSIPRDLVEFWSQTGGGDLFDDSETILRPTQVLSVYPGFVNGDDVDSATQFRIQNGMPDSYLLFHKGTFFSAVRLPDQKFVTLDDKFQETAEFATLNEWYTLTLRSELGKHYGLSIESEKS
jgi:hypothetical protein